MVVDPEGGKEKGQYILTKTSVKIQQFNQRTKGGGGPKVVGR